MQSSSLATTSPARGLLLDVISVRIIEIPNSTNHTLFNFQRSTEAVEACRELRQDDPAPKTTVATVLSSLCSSSLAWNVRAGVPAAGLGIYGSIRLRARSFFTLFAVFSQPSPLGERLRVTSAACFSALLHHNLRISALTNLNQLASHFEQRRGITLLLSIY